MNGEASKYDSWYTESMLLGSPSRSLPTIPTQHEKLLPYVPLARNKRPPPPTTNRERQEKKDLEKSRLDNLKWLQDDT